MTLAERVSALAEASVVVVVFVSNNPSRALIWRLIFVRSKPSCKLEWAFRRVSIETDAATHSTRTVATLPFVLSLLAWLETRMARAAHIICR